MFVHVCVRGCVCAQAFSLDDIVTKHIISGVQSCCCMWKQRLMVKLEIDIQSCNTITNSLINLCL